MKTLKMKSMKSLLLATVFTLGMYQPAYAASVDAAGAMALQQKLTASLENYKKQMGLPESAQSGLKILGDVDVTPKDDYYAVIMPVLEFRIDNDVRIDFGQIKMNMQPAGNDDWKYSMLLPPKMSVLNHESQEIATLTIGKQVTQGIWNERYEISSKSKVKIEDLAFQTTGMTTNGNFTAKIDVIENFTNLERDDNNLYSGPQNYKLSNFVVKFDDTKSDGDFRIREISGDAHVDGMSLEVVEKINKLNSILEEVGNAAASPEQAKALEVELANMIRGFGTFLRSGTSSMDIKGVTGRINDQMGVERTFDMEKFGILFKAASLDTAAGMVGLGFDVQDLKATPVPAGAEQYSPINMNFDLELRNFPFKEVLNFAADNMGNPTPQTGMQMIELFRKAMTELHIQETVFSLGKYDIEVNTILKPNASGLPTPDMKTVIGFVGMDELLSELQKKQQAGTATREEMQAVGVIAMVQQMGQNATSAKSGSPMRQYIFETQSDGRMFLNGSDVQPMIGMFMGQAMGMGQTPAQPGM